MHFTVTIVFLQIYEADINNGGSVREIVTKGLTNPRSVAVDWINDRLYILDGLSTKIELVSIDGLHQHDVVHYLVHPTDVVVDPHARYVVLYF